MKFVSRWPRLSGVNAERPGSLRLLRGILSVAALGLILSCSDNPNNPNDDNHAPIASIEVSPDSLREGDDNNTAFVLDASASTDPEGDDLTYEWIVPVATYLNSTSSTSEVAQVSLAPTSTTPIGIVLVASDPDGLADTATTAIPIIANQLPVAEIVSSVSSISVNDQNSTVIILDGSGSSDGNGDELSFLWDAPGATFESGTASTDATAEVTFSANEDFWIRLTVSDGYGGENTDSILMTVTNQSPSAQIRSTHEFVPTGEDTDVGLDGLLSTDPEDQDLTYEWILPGSVTLSSGTLSDDSIVVSLPGANPPAEIRLIVSDETGAQDTTSIEVPANDYPIVDIQADIDTIPRNDGNTTIVTLDGSASSDPNGDSIEYEWEIDDATFENGSESDDAVVEVSFTGTTSVWVRLSVEDSLGAQTTDSLRIPVENISPVAVITTDPPFIHPDDENEQVVFSSTSSFDPDGGSVTMEWMVPPGTVVTSGSSGTPTITVEADTSTVVTLIVVDDEGGADTTNARVPGNRIPTAFLTASDSTIPPGDGNTTVVTLDGSGSSDPDGDVLTYAWDIEGATFENGTAPDEETVDVSFPGTNNRWVRLTVSDSLGGTSSDSLLLLVETANQVAYVVKSDDVVIVVDMSDGNVLDSIPLPAGSNPVAVEFTPDGSLAYVANTGNNTVSIIDASSRTVLDNVLVGGEPVGIAFTPDGTEAWIANRFSDDVTLIDVSTGMVTSTIDVGLQPGSVGFTPDGTVAYVPHGGEKSLSVVDVASGTVVDTLEFAWETQYVVFNGDGSLAIVTNRFGYFAVDVATGAELEEVGLESLLGSPMVGLEWSTDLDRGFIAGDENVALFNPYDYTATRFLFYGGLQWEAIQVGFGGTVFYSMDSEGYVRVHSTESLEQVRIFPLPSLGTYSDSDMALRPPN